jgi:hypothetical protein
MNLKDQLILFENARLVGYFETYTCHNFILYDGDISGNKKFLPFCCENTRKTMAIFNVNMNWILAAMLCRLFVTLLMDK